MIRKSVPTCALLRPVDPANFHDEAPYCVSYDLPAAWAPYAMGGRVFEALPLAGAAANIFACETARAFRPGIAIEIFGERFAIFSFGVVLGTCRPKTEDELRSAIAHALARENLRRLIVDERDRPRSVTEDAGMFDELGEGSKVEDFHDVELLNAKDQLELGAGGRWGPLFLALLEDELMRRATSGLFEEARRTFATTCAGGAPARLAHELCAACGNRADECFCAAAQPAQALAKPGEKVADGKKALAFALANLLSFVDDAVRAGVLNGEEVLESAWYQHALAAVKS